MKKKYMKWTMKHGKQKIVERALVWMIGGVLVLLQTVIPGRVVLATTYNYSIIDAVVPGPSTYTIVTGINDAGQIVGYYQDSPEVHGFLYEGGIFTLIDVPGASATRPWDISNAGQIVGNASGSNHGFLYDGSNFSTIVFPGAVSTSVRGINNSGHIVGSYTLNELDPSGNFFINHGFLYNGFTFSTIDFPGAVSTSVNGINNSGHLGGTYTFGDLDSSSTFSISHGFFYDGFNFDTFDFPGFENNTSGNDINDAGQIVGDSSDVISIPKAFLLEGGVFTTLAPPGSDPESDVQQAWGINNFGHIVGHYSDINGTHGFLAAPAEKLTNISTRGFVGTGDSSMIGGFIIEGTVPKTVLLRARGPSLSARGVAGAMANPSIRLFSGSTMIAQNDDWQTTDPLCLSPATFCGDDQDIIGTGLDPCSIEPSGCSLESGIYITLPPGTYTVFMFGVGGGTGVGIVEVFDVDTGATAQLTNISTRAFVGTGDSSMIGGFIIEGTDPKTVLLRARGPSLTARGVSGAMANPFIRLFSGQTMIAQNVNWQNTDPLCDLPAISCGDAQDIIATGLDPCSIEPTGCTLESGIYITLPPGTYTVFMFGLGGGTGVGIFEVFEVP